MNAMDHGYILSNRADLSADGDAVTNNACDCCDDPLLFAMRDNYHDFSIGLFTILNCLKLAEREGVVPKLPDEWWIDLHNQYRLNFHKLE